MYKYLLTVVLAVGSLAACKSNSSDPPAADNTARNDRDRTVTPTADNAGNSSSDVDLTQRIRKAVVGTDGLSMDAQNCKIVVQTGKVTLAGPVASDAERTRVAQIAADIAGPANVVNQLEVKN